MGNLPLYFPEIARFAGDVLGVAESLTGLDAQAAALESLGYLAHGEFGLAGRRYFTPTDTNASEP